jgi:hypothetical protein
MNGPLDPATCQDSIPTFLKAIARPQSLLPGERLQDFEAIRDAVIQDVGPRSGLEWLWTMDLIDLSWDIVRYRALRQKLLENYREAAIEAILQRIDLAGIAPESLLPAQNRTKQNAAQWRTDSKAAEEIENRLILNGFDAGSINLETIVQSRELFLMFEALTHSAQVRRISLLRELNSRRSPARKYRMEQL